MKVSYQYRLYPSKSQSAKLQTTLDLCRELYNSALQERRDAYMEKRISVNYYSQTIQLPYIKMDRSEFKGIHSQILQDVLRRLDKAFQNFFRRVKNHEKSGYPRFRGKNRYFSFTYPQYGKGAKIVGNCIRLCGVGNVQIKMHRSIEGKIKTCTINRSPTGKWFASFSCECDPIPLPKSSEFTGIDVGLHSFAVLSNGEMIQNPRFFHEYEKRLAKSQRVMEKQPKGSSERFKKRKVVSHIHEKMTNKRSDFTHKKSREIVNQYGIICIEDLAIHRMIQNKQYSKEIQDAAWGQFAFCLSYKAEWAGRKTIASDPSYTSQVCNACGSLSHEFIGRMFHCLNCDNLMDRDHNAAINIETVGLYSLGLKKIREATPQMAGSSHIDYIAKRTLED